MSGDFTLTLGNDTTETISYPLPGTPPTEASVQAALELLPSVGVGNVDVVRDGNTYRIEFIGTKSQVEFAEIIVNSLSLVRPVEDDQVTLADNADTVANRVLLSQHTITGLGMYRVNEVQVVTIDASGGTFQLRFDGVPTVALDHDASAAIVQAALENLATVGVGNVAVSRMATGSDLGGATSGGNDGSIYVVRFQGELSAQNLVQLQVIDIDLAAPVDGTGSTADPTAVASFSVNTRTEGSNQNPTNEVQALDIVSSSGSFLLDFGGGNHFGDRHFGRQHLGQYRGRFRCSAQYCGSPGRTEC